ncbi:unnamed protein product [Mytilus edulis]|uniref:TRIM2_3 n=1 Tax=Mytilus edulis TaxID=6550 RepID=A0A8S3TVU7_MYTED|nr:unnamed protein product [Mytilus edulis]
MEERTSQLNQLQSQFTTMTKYATALQMYIGLREIEKKISETAKYIEDLENRDHISEKNLEVKIASGIQTISSKVKSFGDIYIKTASSTLQTKAGRKDQAQYLVSELDQIKPSFLTQLRNPANRETLRIKACRILPDGKFIILPYRKKQLLLFSNDGILIRIVVTFTEDTCDACVVRNNTVAVALGNQTTLVDIEKNKIIETIKPSHECYVVASDGNFYGTKEFENEVSCYDSTGEPLWTLQDKAIVYPVGMTLDMNGFVYIASLGNNSVVVISSDGKSCKTILTETDGIDEPYGIDINKDTGMMIVSVNYGQILMSMETMIQLFVYQV